MHRLNGYEGRLVMVTFNDLLLALGNNIAIDRSHRWRHGNFELSGLCTDSRRATEGCVFVCLKGLNVDGHDFTDMACARGASVIIAKHDKSIEICGNSTMVIYVADTDKALSRIIHLFYPDPVGDLKIIGITGTKGKTTTALMLSHILECDGKKVGYIGTNGVIYGQKHFQTVNTTPDMLSLYTFLEQMRCDGVEYVVLEVSSQGLWKRRIAGLRFEAVVFTNIYEDHIGGVEHPSFKHYFNSKAQLFLKYEAKHVIFNADARRFTGVFRQLEKSKLIPFSVEREIGTHARDVKSSWGEDGFGISFTYVTRCGGEHDIYIPMLGEYNVYNALAAICTAHALGVDPDTARLAIKDVCVSGRGEVFRSNSGAVFIIDYAHNEESLTEVLKSIRLYRPRKLYCIVGSVGGRSESRRYGIGRAAALNADYTILTADNPDYEPIPKICEDIRAAFLELGLEEHCRICCSRKEAIELAHGLAGDGDIVLLAGKGHEKYQLISGERIPFSEREILEQLSRDAAPIEELV